MQKYKWNRKLFNLFKLKICYINNFLINFPKVIETKSWIKLSFIYFDSNNQILIPLSSFFYQHFDQMNGTWPIWSHYPIDPIIRDPIKWSLLYIKYLNSKSCIVSVYAKLSLVQYSVLEGMKFQGGFCLAFPTCDFQLDKEP
jgi:hypothetical protein